MEEQKKQIDKSSPDWHDYVMQQFQENELFQGYPKTDGLRRIVELLLGKIIRSESKVLQSPKLNNDKGYTYINEIVVVEHRVEIQTETHIIIVQDVADVWQGNTDSAFLKFPTAVAATRAEGRALRKALNLKTIAAEELSGGTNFDIDTKGEITEAQINFINILCSRNDINVMKYINSGSKKYNQIEEISFETAVKMVSRLSELQANSEKIDNNIKGYDLNWRKKNESASEY